MLEIVMMNSGMISMHEYHDYDKSHMFPKSIILHIPHLFLHGLPSGLLQCMEFALLCSLLLSE